MTVRPPPDPVHEHDASIRTELAWSRSGLALLACFAILARHVWDSGAERGDAIALGFIAIASLGWAIGLGIGVRRSRGRNLEPRTPRDLLALALGTVAVGAAGLVITFVSA
jgi:hypothetical protein